MVEALLDDVEMRQVLSDQCLHRIPDLQRITRKFRHARASLEDCVRVYEVVSLLPSLRSALGRAASGRHGTLVSELFIVPLSVCCGSRRGRRSSCARRRSHLTRWHRSPRSAPVRNSPSTGSSSKPPLTWSWRIVSTSL